MRFDKNHLLWFGPVTIVVEWVALLIGVIWLKEFDTNNAISAVTVAVQPFPVIFGITLTIIAITYTLFSLPLRQYSKNVPVVAVFAGLAFIITGWTPYTGIEGVGNIIHNTASFIAACGYIAIIWLLRKHPKKHVSSASKMAYKLTIIGVLLVVVGVFITHKYVSLAQLLVLFIIQIWTVYIVWHERRGNLV